MKKKSNGFVVFKDFDNFFSHQAIKEIKQLQCEKEGSCTDQKLIKRQKNK